MLQPEPQTTGEEARGAVRCEWMTRRGREEEGCARGSGRVGAAVRVSLAGLRGEDALFMEAGVVVEEMVT